MDIVVYDYLTGKELNHTEQTISVYAEVHYNDIGNCEIVIDSNNPLVETLLKNKFVTLKINNKYEFIVTQVTFREDEVEIYGRTLNWILTKCFIDTDLPFKDISVDFMLSSVCTNASNFRIRYDDNGIDLSRFFSYDLKAYDKKLSEIVKTILDNDGIGESLIINHDTKYFVISLKKGKELNFYISRNDNTAESVERTIDVLDFCNGGYYEFESEDGAKEWKHINKNDSSSTLLNWFTKFSAKTESEATEELKKYKINDEIDAIIQNLEFEKDYNLGDIVNVQFEIGSFMQTVKNRIESVSMNWDENGYEEKPVLKEVEEGGV